MKFSGKTRFMIILKVTKDQGFTLTLEDTFLIKPQGTGGAKSRFRVKMRWNNKKRAGKQKF